MSSTRGRARTSVRAGIGSYARRPSRKTRGPRAHPSRGPRRVREAGYEPGKGSASVPRRIQLSMNRLRSLSGDLTSGYSRRDISFIRSILIRRLLPEARRRPESACGRQKSSTGSGQSSAAAGRPSAGGGNRLAGSLRGSGRERREPGRCRRASPLLSARPSAGVGESCLGAGEPVHAPAGGLRRGWGRRWEGVVRISAGQDMARTGRAPVFDSGLPTAL